MSEDTKNQWGMIEEEEVIDLESVISEEQARKKQLLEQEKADEEFIKKMYIEELQS